MILLDIPRKHVHLYREMLFELGGEPPPVKYSGRFLLLEVPQPQWIYNLGALASFNLATMPPDVAEQVLSSPPLTYISDPPSIDIWSWWGVVLKKDGDDCESISSIYAAAEKLIYPERELEMAIIKHHALYVRDNRMVDRCVDGGMKEPLPIFYSGAIRTMRLVRLAA
jgi:hypothetical protein